MQNKKLQVWLPLLFSLVMIAGMIIGYKVKTNMPDTGIFFTEKPKPLQEVLDLIKNKYVDNENADSLGDAAIDAVLSKLDPHSVFLPATQLQSAKEDLQGGFSGIGVEFNIFSDTINVLNVIKDGPSDKAGLQIGDKFLKVGDSVVAGVKITSDKIKNLLRGDGGSKADITILRGKEQKHFTIIRGMIPLYSLDAAYMITDSIGYIRLNKFAETTYHEFMDATLKLQKQGMKSMILDLRNNGGGILTQATNIADEFLDQDKLITYTEGAHSPKKEYRCEKEGIFEKGKLVVLANEGSASASEILIGALQDWDRATIIGRRTFGKGLVQEQYELSDGSGLRLTVARYYTPLGRSIQKSYSAGIKVYEEDMMNRMHDGEMMYFDSIKHTNGKAYTTKSGKIVYSGGGITPDIFVSVDTSGFNAEIRKIYIKGTINKFVYGNYLANKNKFMAYASPGQFEKNYLIDDVTWNSFKAFAATDSINMNVVDEKEKSELLKQIKILTARQIWRNEGLYEVSNTEDATIKKALEVLTK
ncbi:MAG TPA: S41 family peptidase [Chitinophagaceae bacterium]